MIFDALCSLGEVDILCFSEDHPPERPLKGRIVYWGNPTTNRRKSPWSLLWFWHRRFIFPQNHAWTSITKEALARINYDHIFVRHIQPALACGLKLEARLAIDADDLPEEHFASAAKTCVSTSRKLYYGLMSFLARVHTNRIARRCHLIFVAKKEQSGKARVWLPNLPVLDNRRPSPLHISAEKTVLFVGLLSYPPNHLGLDRFLDKIWPHVLAQRPDAQLRIAGHGLPADLQQKWNKITGIALLGFVPDIIDEYNKSRVIIVPIYQGSGTNIKVLEAMLCGRPSVISSFASRGFDDLIENEKTALVAATDEEFAAKINLLLHDTSLAQEIASNAYKAVRDYCQEHSAAQIIAQQL